MALDGEGKVVGEGDMTRQSEYVMDQLSRVLADQGCTFDDVTHIRTFLIDMSLLPEYGAVRGRHITGGPRPARRWRCRGCSRRSCSSRWT
ncbi:RidA family protein [Streptosporangium sp. NPDC002607]